MDLVRAGLRPRDIVTRKALENAAAVVAATGGSTNAALASTGNRSRMRDKNSTLFEVAEIFKRTPYIADLKPAGRYVAKDLFEAGGVPTFDENAARSWLSFCTASASRLPSHDRRKSQAGEVGTRIRT